MWKRPPGLGWKAKKYYLEATAQEEEDWEKLQPGGRTKRSITESKTL